MRSPARTAWSAIALSSAILLAGCGSQADLAKVTHPRTVVPAKVAPKTQPNQPPRPVEPAFAAERLRAVDPCQLMDTQTLSGFGVPAASRSVALSDCANYMKDGSGKRLSITLRLGQNITILDTAKTIKVGGLTTVESTSTTTCFVKSVTQEGSSVLGIVAQVDYEGDSCDVGRRLNETVINRIRTNPPLRAQDNKGSVTVVDPCAVFPAVTATELLGGTPTISSYDMYRCTFRRDSLYFGIEFREATDPKDSSQNKKAQVVTIDGVTIYQRKEDSFNASCKMEWMHKATTAGKGEVVEVSFDNSKKGVEVDLCGKATTVVKALLPKLPKP
ncbi:DUF3558 domain-containing protein [Allokutzneria sp. A3M-2-11 16]|uniref:DUF3558 domain-containing protein n=1 Tax=Allokutzneria sp. A3M-2-11 16 TaxID=2962043 RepID=UPI0020B87318|nr:DUF3558 domain-containing protein [Allokutzneria sp. A3M-2-11 16]MCP3798219.1 DUF3558 domain-containing protein [Allokutzneria sp. A3M-2-11 16]